MVLVLTFAASPCTAGRKKAQPTTRQQAKRNSAHRAAGGKKSLKRAKERQVRWHPGLSLARRMQSQRVVKR